MDSSFAQFCTAAFPRLVAALAHHTGDRHLAEELAQEALIRAGDRWERVRRLQSPVGWAFHVGANLARSRFRRRKAERRARARLQEPAPHPSPEVVVEREAVRAALADLPERERQVVVLRYYLGLPATDAAAVLGSTPGAVRTATSRALARLRTLLDDPTEALDAR